jgi:hypothetical protein
MNKLRYILIFLVIVIGSIVYSQGQVIVHLRQPPAYSFHIENMWNVTLTNTTQSSLSVFLRGTANLENEGIIANAHTSVFTLNAGTKVVNASEIKPIHLDDVVSKYEAPVKHLGAVPNGNYDICVYVINAADNSVLGQECISTEVMNVSQLNLISPDDGEIFAGENMSFPKDTSKTKGKTPREITLNQSQTSSNIIFSWVPPSPVNAAVHFTYKLKIVQQIGSQSGYDAMQSNPLYYSAGNLNVTSYQYPLAARHFTAGKYAWQVEAYLDGVLVSSSEVREFRYGVVQKSNSQAIRLAWIKKQWALKDGTGLNSASGTELKSKPFLFSFDSKIYGESSIRSGTGSDKKPQYGYTELTPSISLFGFPFGTSILLSSENSENRQNINSAGLNLDASSIKDFIMEKVEKEKDKILEEGKKELSQLTDKAKDKLESDAKSKVMSKLNPALKFISYFSQMGFGTTYPDYTPLTVRGVPLTGVNLEFNPGWFYVAVGGFKNQKPIDNSAYRRDLYTGRIGVGQKDGSHVYLTGLYAKDNENSIKVDSTNNILTPKANYVFGIEGKLNLFRKKLSLEGEISGAMLTRDTRDADLDNASIPAWVKNMIHPKISSSVDFAYTLKGIYDNDKSKTKITTGLKMIGPGYTSLGVPTLATDKLESVTKISQKLANNRISLNASFTWSKDNLIDWKRYTTSYMTFLISANYTPKNLPYFNITYMPTFQKNNASVALEKIDNKIHMLVFSTGHYYRKWDINFNSSLNYVMNVSDSPDSLSRTSSHNLQFSQSFGFIFPLTFSASVGLTFSKLQGIPDRIISADFSGNYIFEDFITIMSGFSTAYERELNKKNSEYFGVSGGYNQYLNIEIRAEKNMYHDWFLNTQDYDEFLLKGTVTLKF